MYTSVDPLLTLTPALREEDSFLVLYRNNKVVSFKLHELKRLQQAEHNTAKLGEVNYRVKWNSLDKGWISAVKTSKSGTRYRLRYEDNDTEELNLEELNDPTCVTLDRTKCPSTMAQTNRAPRRTACGKCKRCLRKNCGQCRQCRDMPRYGGPGKLNERCIKRRCEAMS